LATALATTVAACLEAGTPIAAPRTGAATAGSARTALPGLGRALAPAGRGLTLPALALSVVAPRTPGVPAIVFLPAHHTCTVISGHMDLSLLILTGPEHALRAAP